MTWFMNTISIKMHLIYNTIDTNNNNNITTILWKKGVFN